MKTLRDAQNAAKSLGHALGRPNQQHADIIADALASLEDRLTADEEILRVLAQRAGVSADDVVQARAQRMGQPPRPPSIGASSVERTIHRILG